MMLGLLGLGDAIHDCKNQTGDIRLGVSVYNTEIEQRLSLRIPYFTDSQATDQTIFIPRAVSDNWLLSHKCTVRYWSVNKNTRVDYLKPE